MKTDVHGVIHPAWYTQWSSLGGHLLDS